jgi:hypothetical protein
VKRTIFFGSAKNGLLPNSHRFKNTFREALFELGQQGDEAFSEMPHHPEPNAHMTICATAGKRLARLSERFAELTGK